MQKRKPRTKIDRLTLQRGKAVLLLLDQHDLTVEKVAEATGRKPDTVYKAIEGRFGDSAVLDHLTRRLGRRFTDLWMNYPDHAA